VTSERQHRRGGVAEQVSTGTSQVVRFKRAGFYPYFCDLHGNDAGGGMAGVVRVIE